MTADPSVGQVKALRVDPAPPLANGEDGGYYWIALGADGEEIKNSLPNTFVTPADAEQAAHGDFPYLFGEMPTVTLDEATRARLAESMKERDA